MKGSILCEIMGLSNLIETIKMNIKKIIIFLTNKRYSIVVCQDREPVPPPPSLTEQIG